MKRLIPCGFLALFSVGASAQGITLLCDEYRVQVEPGELAVNGRHYVNPQEQPYGISDQYSGRSLIFTDSNDKNKESNWAAVHIITQADTGKKAFFFSDNHHKDEKAIVCSLEDPSLPTVR
ncbi:hypothetical protein [Vagococcus sp. WN89Y]|uniref:hypothetical protein n=1 Tax=Vagococcus sp. WN89Y TaxID=3457258 RepID=UPI003FCE6653